ncbi:hypothetical protein [Spiroplasma endosymbiont of Cantharis rufa]|uniref:hypothetical protein n=1 Tax=Spiroplasma endosymbiont of Cantharis rufa TaxID=3066279 RepID=UPI0030D3EB12
MKNKKNSLKTTFINQLIIFKNQKTNWLIYVIAFLSIFLSELISSLILNTNKSVENIYLSINLIIIINSIIFLFITIFYSLTILLNQIVDNTYKLELRYGITKKSIFFSRVMFILIVLFSFLLISLLKSIIFYSIFLANGNANILVYKIYISVYGWYSIFVLMVFSVTILFSMLLKRETIIGTLATLFSVLLLVVVSLLGMISSFNSSSNIKQFNNMAMNFSYANQQFEEIKKSEKISNLHFALQQPEFMSMDIEEVMAGYKTWELEVQNKAVVFEDISLEIESLFSESKINTWENVYEFSNDYTTNSEEILKLTNKAIEAKNGIEYHEVYNFINKDAVNYLFYQELDLSYKPKKINLNLDLQEKIKNNYSPDEYLFTRTLMNKVYYIISERPFTKMEGSVITTEDIINAQKVENIKNVFNPLRHFSLMYQSVDYKNDVLINQIGARQKLFSSLNNIKSYSKESEITITNLKAKRFLKVEILYITYTLISLILIFSAYSIFINKKSY